MTLDCEVASLCTRTNFSVDGYEMGVTHPNRFIPGLSELRRAKAEPPLRENTTCLPSLPCQRSIRQLEAKKEKEGWRRGHDTRGRVPPEKLNLCCLNRAADQAVYADGLPAGLRLEGQERITLPVNTLWVPPLCERGQFNRCES